MQHADEFVVPVQKRVMDGMEKTKMPKAMPFDPKRMAYGGFKVIVEG